jgi:hypothetical protein
MSARTIRTLLATIAVSSVALLVAQGNGVTTAQRPAPAVRDATDYLFASIHAHIAGAGIIRSYESLADFLPNTLVRVAGVSSPASVFAPSALIVRGRVIDVRPGRAFKEGSAEADATEADRRDVAYSARDASWRTVHFTIQVEEAFGRVLGARTLPVGLAVAGNASYDLLRRGLLDMGSAVFALYPRSPVFAYTRGLWAIHENGALIAPVSSSGVLSLPAFEGDAARFLRGASTLAQLRTSAQGLGKILTVKRQGAITFLVGSAPRTG